MIDLVCVFTSCAMYDQFKEFEVFDLKYFVTNFTNLKVCNARHKHVVLESYQEQSLINVKFR